MAVFRTVCPRNCYCTCGMLVTVEDGRITRIEGDRENPATGGHVCLKGISYARRVSSPDRILQPLRRTRSGAFDRVGWNEALDDIAARLERVRREAGPEAALYYEGSGSHGALGRLAMAFWHQFGGCTLTYGDLCWPAGLEATRLTYGANLHNHPRLTTASRFILVWGHNPAETNVHQWRLILDAQERGARLAVVDPRSTDTTDAADIHLQPRPGTDAALALGLARAIVDAGLPDHSFLEAHALGLEQYLDRLREYPVERAAAITGVAAGAIRELAGAYASERPALLIAGFGLQRNHHAGQTTRAVALLPALTGNVGVAGGGWQYANLASHVLVDPPLPPEPAGVRRTIPVSRLGPCLAELESPRVAAAWVEKGNPASQNPRSRTVRDAFSRLDLLVVVDQIMTDTARLAHYVLPAKTLFEEEDVCTAYWHPYVQRRAKLFVPPGEVKTETEIWRLMCDRFGFDTSWFPQTDDDARSLLGRMLPAGLTLESLERAPGQAEGARDIAFEDRRFFTPSGRIEFVSADAARLWGVDAVPDYTPLPEGHESGAAVRFPLQLLTCKTRDRIHSQFGNVDWVRDVERPHMLDMHPSDASARDLVEGELAEVWNDRGRIELRVRLDEGLRPGVVHVLEGRCHEGDPDVNVLTDAGVTDMNHGATFFECLVEVARRSGASRRPRLNRSPRRGPVRNQPRTGDPRPLPASASTDRCAPTDRRPATERPAPTDRSTPTDSRAATDRPAPTDRSTPTDSRPATDGRTPTSFLLDLNRCVGCSACVLACRLENGWSGETPWRRVLPLNLRRRPGGPTYFLSVACHHCERPACVAACPSGAYEKRADGIVVHREERCIGCRYCEMACPFGAPRYSQQKKVMTKCHFCHHRLDGGSSPGLSSLPACIAACPTEALRLNGRERVAGVPAVCGIHDDERAARGGVRGDTVALVPGFADPDGCHPTTRYRPPRGTRRGALLRALQDRLEK